MKRLVLPLALALTSLAGQAQPGKTVTLSVAEARKIKDSLDVLPLVRRQASQWQAASGAYRQSADSLRRALALRQQIEQSYQTSQAEEKRLVNSATAEATEWRSKARKRGVINVLLAVLTAGVGFLAIVR